MQHDKTVRSVVELTDCQHCQFVLFLCFLPFLTQQIPYLLVIVLCVLTRDEQIWV